jgi:hypothetical protein
MFRREHYFNVPAGTFARTPQAGRIKIVTSGANTPGADSLLRADANIFCLNQPQVENIAKTA